MARVVGSDVSVKSELVKNSVWSLFLGEDGQAYILQCGDVRLELSRNELMALSAIVQEGLR